MTFTIYDLLIWLAILLVSVSILILFLFAVGFLMFLIGTRDDENYLDLDFDPDN
jgi:hypothetical protein